MADLRRHLPAMALGAGLAVLACLAAIGRVAASPAVADLPALARFGPGPLGMARANADGALAALATPDLARQALIHAPLAWEPFLAAASRSTADGATADGAAAEGGTAEGGAGRVQLLLQMAVQRDPRAIAPRLELARIALAQGRLDSAIAQLAVIRRLDRVLVDQLIGQLGRATMTADQADQAIAAFAPYPELYQPYITGFSGESRPAALQVHVVNRLPPATLAGVAAIAPLRDAAVALLVKAGAYEPARQLWGNGRSLGRAGAIYNPDFADAASAPPFNWELAQNAAGAAEYNDQGGGLEISAFGRAGGVLVRQLLNLGPGRHAIGIEWEPLSGDGGVIAVQLRCADDGEVLARANLDAMRSLSLAFSLPDGRCSGQYVELAGSVVDSGRGQSVIVRRIALRGGPQS